MTGQQGRVSTFDLIETAARMIDAAVAVTTGRLHLSTVQEARRLLVHGDATAVGYFRFELARQFGAALLMMVPHVVAVFEDQDVPDAEEAIPADAPMSEPIRLFVQTDFASAALTALVDALNHALDAAISEALDRPPCGLFQVTIVDDRNSRILRARAYGFRPAPILLASREDTVTDQAPF
jgi:hypothetical protein